MLTFVIWVSTSLDRPGRLREHPDGLALHRDTKAAAASNEAGEHVTEHNVREESVIHEIYGRLGFEAQAPGRLRTSTSGGRGGGDNNWVG